MLYGKTCKAWFLVETETASETMSQYQIQFTAWCSQMNWLIMTEQACLNTAHTVKTNSTSQTNTVQAYVTLPGNFKIHVTVQYRFVHSWQAWAGDCNYRGSILCGLLNQVGHAQTQWMSMASGWNVPTDNTSETFHWMHYKRLHCSPINISWLDCDPVTLITGIVAGCFGTSVESQAEWVYEAPPLCS